MYYSHLSMKNSVDVSHPGRTKMHYVTCTSHWVQKQKFGGMFPSALFMETAPSPLDDEK
jgi:hypothetical protein